MFIPSNQIKESLICKGAHMWPGDRQAIKKDWTVIVRLRPRESWPRRAVWGGAPLIAGRRLGCEDGVCSGLAGRLRDYLCQCCVPCAACLPACLPSEFQLSRSQHGGTVSLRALWKINGISWPILVASEGNKATFYTKLISVDLFQSFRLSLPSSPLSLFCAC